MARFVPDVKTQRWIIITPSRTSRPDQYVYTHDPVKNVCVFCPGNEALTPGEVYRVGGGEKDKVGWSIRVIPNKFPITDTHEVIIHSPNHVRTIEDFEMSHVESLVRVYKERYLLHSEHGQVMIFCNFGEHAGASLQHPHSQVVVIPKQINLDSLAKEPIANVIEETTRFIGYCPDFSQWPYEVWLAPKQEKTSFGDISEEDIKDLSGIFQRSLRKLRIMFDRPEVLGMRKDWPFAYNFYIHHEKDWFLRIVPRLVHRAGFELGTGLSVNIVDPVKAAETLRAINLH